MIEVPIINFSPAGHEVVGWVKIDDRSAKMLANGCNLARVIRINDKGEEEVIEFFVTPNPIVNVFKPGHSVDIGQ